MYLTLESPGEPLGESRRPSGPGDPLVQVNLWSRRPSGPGEPLGESRRPSGPGEPLVQVNC